MRGVIQQMRRLIHRLREQARSHILSGARRYYFFAASIAIKAGIAASLSAATF